jgi:ketol-acid reductoisomerase
MDAGEQSQQAVFSALRRQAAEHPIEEVGAGLRSMMQIGASKIVDKTKN